VAMEDGPAAKSSLNLLAKFLKSKDLELRLQAAQAIGQLRERAKSKLPDLVAMLRDPEPAAVQAACTALGYMGDKSDKVVDALLDVLPNKDLATSAAAA